MIGAALVEPRPRLQTSVWNGLVVWVISGGATAHEVRELERRLGDESFAGSEFGLLVVVEGSAWIPSIASQRAATSLLQSHARRLRLVAVVFEGRAWHTRLLRRIFAGISAQTLRRYPLRVFAEGERAARWICAQIHDAEGASPRPAALVSRVDALRR